MNIITNNKFFKKLSSKTILIILAPFTVVATALYFLKKWLLKTAFPALKKFLSFSAKTEKPMFERKVFITGDVYYIYEPATAHDIDDMLNPDDLYRIKEVPTDFTDKTYQGINAMRNGIKCGLQALQIAKEVNKNDEDEDLIPSLYSTALNEILAGDKCPEGIRYLYNVILLSSCAITVKIDDEARNKGVNLLMKESIRNLVKCCEEFKNSGYFNSDGKDFNTVKNSFVNILYLVSRCRMCYHQPLCTLTGLFSDQHKAFLEKCNNHLSISDKQSNESIFNFGIIKKIKQLIKKFH